MSEFWVSRKKYLCKYCDIFIADDAPSRAHHESGLRHKGNKERFVRNLYKSSEQKKKDLDEEKRELARVQKMANESYASDVAAGIAKPMTSASTSAPATSTSKAPPPKSTSKYANYSTAESLGFYDEEAKRLADEKALKQNAGVIGEWTVVAPPIPSRSDAGPSNDYASSSSTPPSDGRQATAEAETETSAAPAAEETDPDDVRGWRLDGPAKKRRKIAVAMGDIYDPGEIKVKRKEGEEAPKEEAPKEEEVPVGSLMPSWSATKWMKPGEATASATSKAEAEARAKAEAEAAAANEAKEDEAVKAEPESTAPSLVKEENTEDTKPAPSSTAPAEPSSGGMFRKRKAPAAGAGSREGNSRK
ncbi:hypothetical protein DL93DRAFT_225342 [Clavulina sp. PMI_390]|nr:hypothetical protein DL93DRAFT_225342 [Clavulina sp. PMI_390]